jgi:hypothetical protein
VQDEAKVKAMLLKLKQKGKRSLDPNIRISFADAYSIPRNGVSALRSAVNVITLTTKGSLTRTGSSNPRVRVKEKERSNEEVDKVRKRKIGVIGKKVGMKSPQLAMRGRSLKGLAVPASMAHSTSPVLPGFCKESERMETESRPGKPQCSPHRPERLLRGPGPMLLA